AVQACDDGDPCTINDEETLAADGSICAPCAGITDPSSCNAGCVTVQACDDGDPCTINDEETLAADGSVCVPCAGITDPSSCNAGCVTVQACDDGDPCTIDDEETLAADGSICVPCAGITDPSSCNAGCVTVQACDDGDPCTINDEETLAADGTVCVPCAGITDPSSCNAGCVTLQACDDGDPCTINDEETLAADGSICIPCAGMLTDCSTGITSVVPCDDGNTSTFNDMQTILSCDGSICEPCMGIACNFTAQSVDVSISDETCPGLSDGGIIITSVGSGQSPYRYTLNGGNFQDTTAFDNLMPGVYTLTVLDANNCSVDLEVLVDESQPFLELGNDQEVGLGEGVPIRPTTNLTASSITWFPTDGLSCIDCLEPVATPTANTTYTLTITDASGCSLTDEITILVDKTQNVFTPNSFSPNDDGVNDRFTIFAGPDVSQVGQLRIFNRWGQTLFLAENIPPNDLSVGWDGRVNGNQLVDIGVYLYVAEVVFFDGRVETISGEVAVLR
ncbi:MAG: gliding motility-associated C-terminal domain-containing protein, partial [Bacteroidota bacterium]